MCTTICSPTCCSKGYSSCTCQPSNKDSISLFSYKVLYFKYNRIKYLSKNCLATSGGFIHSDLGIILPLVIVDPYLGRRRALESLVRFPYVQGDAKRRHRSRRTLCGANPRTEVLRIRGGALSGSRMRQRKESRTPPCAARHRRINRLGREFVVLSLLRAREGMVLSGTQTW